MADEEKAPPLSKAMKIRPRSDAKNKRILFHFLHVKEQAFEIFSIF